MMRRPAEFPDFGKTYNIEWTPFQGTAPMTQALATGALDCATQAPLSLANGVVGEKSKAYVVASMSSKNPAAISVYWAVKDNSPIKTIAESQGQDNGHLRDRRRHLWSIRNAVGKNGVDPKKDIKLVEVSFAVSEDALRQGRVDAVNMNQPFAARAEAKGGTRKLFALSEAMPNIVHILEACRADFVDKNPELVRAYVRDITSGMKKTLANREETLKVVSEVLKAPVSVLDTYCSRTTISAAIRVRRRISMRPEDARHLHRDRNAAGRRAVHPDHRGTCRWVPVIASKPKCGALVGSLDCFVAALLAMTRSSSVLLHIFKVDPTQDGMHEEAAIAGDDRWS